MIAIQENLSDGDLVYAWYSPFKEKANKKPEEHEFRFQTAAKGMLKLQSVTGDYHVIFPKELIETWFGNVRKVK